ncbi:MAG TPA: hypothetical protein VHP11_16385, partial [Tepidisphaeraceae bacterium]|nr:hypothetical protein [Tepidisphaeraceae bacterium]
MDGSNRAETIAATSIPLTIPASAEGYSAEPLNLKTLDLKVIPRLRLGQPLPSLDLRKPDGAPLKWADFNGRHVLVHFYSPRRPDSLSGQTAHGLRIIHDRFGDRPSFTILSVAMEASPSSLGRLAAPLQFPWPQAKLGDEGAALPPEFLNSSSLMFLLAPDGTLLARNLEPRSAFDAIDRALGKPQSPSGIQVVTEHIPLADARPTFRFKTIPAPSSQDLASHASLRFIGEDLTHQPSLSPLTDGRLPSTQDDPAANFYVSDGLLSARILLDLTGPRRIGSINTYSWHKSTRAAQIYKLWAADGSAANFNPA